jgi:hypothetical protein
MTFDRVPGDVGRRVGRQGWAIAVCRLSRPSVKVALVMALFGAAGAGPLCADDDDDLAEVRPEPTRGQLGALNQRFQIGESHIDRWVYGNNSVGGNSSLAAALKQKINGIGKVCGLSEFQRAKLNLAGESDIQRFVTRVEDLKSKCQTGVVTQEQFNALVQSAQPLRIALQQGLFENGSLFHKTLLSNLRPEQAARCEQVDRERRTYRYRARVELTVAQLDAILGLSDEQRVRLVQLILDKTRLPRHFGQFDRVLVLVQLARLPEETLATVIEPAQWPQLRKELANARRMIPTLKRNGVVVDEGPDSTDEADAALHRPQIEAPPPNK